MPSTFAFRLSALCALIILLALAAPTGAQTPPPITVTPTPDPYAGLSVDELAARNYGRGAVTIVETMGSYPEFTRYLVSYPSDDLTIYGFMNVPVGEGPFPVIIALHGYIDPAVYGTLDYTTRYADDLARAGFLVLHPNLRGYGPSSNGLNLFRVGMAVDVLHLVGLVRQTGGLPGALAPADPDAIGLWGHSMGGGISLRTITVSADVRAAVLYGAMSGNEAWNYAKIQEWSGGTRGRAEMRAPDEVIQRISPIEYLERIQTAVSIHHGTADDQVPLEWAADLCQRLNALGKSVECFAYEGQPHTFTGEGDRLFVQRTIDFFNRWLRGG
ncbi:MAG: alpha/beta fold hydrolase [Anaerolineae bacterium]|nr:alpha/beta fold hydrolase [Anaerolineae bacterium]